MTFKNRERRAMAFVNRDTKGREVVEHKPVLRIDLPQCFGYDPLPDDAACAKCEVFFSCVSAIEIPAG